MINANEFYQASKSMATNKLKEEALLDSIFNESCIDTMKRIPDNFLDVVITSPPYNMNLRIRKTDKFHFVPQQHGES